MINYPWFLSMGRYILTDVINIVLDKFSINKNYRWYMFYFKWTSHCILHWRMVQRSGCEIHWEIHSPKIKINCFMKRKYKWWRSTIKPISMKRTLTLTLKSLSTKKRLRHKVSALFSLHKRSLHHQTLELWR